MKQNQVEVLQMAPSSLATGKRSSSVLDPYERVNVDINQKHSRVSEGGLDKLEAGRENSSMPVVHQREKLDKERCPGSVLEGGKYGCQFCLKEFANSNALGGGGGVTKMPTKRASSQRKSGINSYLQPLIKSHGSEYNFSIPRIYDASHCMPEHMLSEESHGSFKLLDWNMSSGEFFAAKPPALTTYMQQNSSKENQPVIIKPLPSSIP